MTIEILKLDKTFKKNYTFFLMALNMGVGVKKKSVSIA